MAEWLHLSDIDPELDEILKTRPRQPEGPHDIPSLRRLAQASKKASIASALTGDAPVDTHERHIPVRDGTEMPVRIYQPKDASKGDGPLFVMLHGGGFCLGDLNSEQINCRNICEKAGFVVVNVDYRLAPEHPFPTPLDDAYDAVKWAAASFSSLRADPRKGFIVGGTSAGANFAAVITHLARDEGLRPPLTGVFLSAPAVLSSTVVPEKYKSHYLSREQNKDAPGLGMDMINMFFKAYSPDPQSPLFSPFIFPTGHLGLPRTYFQVCGMDPLRDEALLYEKVLREECAVPTRVDVYPGVPHGFWSAHPGLTATKKRFADAVDGARWLLEEAR
ncbi:MAG: hypothetical protein M1832_003803 [Thelocarpon impressellum]|nr:MAG: hypothetical protein M1832_003803 [Thelocarpon impressellum]